MEKTVRAVIIEDNKLLVFFRRKLVNNKMITYYALPGGHLEENETLEETVIRELKEEMNVDIKILDYLGMIKVGGVLEYYYNAKIVGGNIEFGGEELERCNENNYYEIRWLKLDELDNSGIRALELVKKVL